MESIVKWLLQPYPLQLTWRKFFISVALGGGFVTFFLYVFRPFGMMEMPVRDALIISCLYGAVTVAVTLFWHGVLYLIEHRIREETWCVWKELLADLLFVSAVGVANMLFSAFIFKQTLSIGLFLEWQKLTFLVGLFPTIFGVFGKQIRLMSMYANEAGAINASLAKRPLPEPAASGNGKIVLTGDNQNESLEIAAADLVYLAAADNYVQVYFAANGSIKSTLLRSTMKKMEDALAGKPEIFRCHRTYLVNLARVTEVSGNAQGFKLHLDGVETPIPVSRSLNEVVHQKLEK